MAHTSKTHLSDIAEGRSCRVVAVKDTSSEFLQYLKKLSINIGTVLKVTEKIAFDESLVIQIEKGRQTTISKKFGQSILVE
jgi:DtxR family Mn-dependent transcriptional regulator